MAVQLPSDIVADVMRNADPVRRIAATNRLQSDTTSSNVSFASYADSLQIRAGEVRGQMSEAVIDIEGTKRAGSGPDVFREFERTVLHNLFEALLPSEDSGSFGSGPSAGVWRTMAAEQLAGAYTEAGGLGIEGMIATSSGKTAMRREGQWPYFALETIDGFRG